MEFKRVKPGLYQAQYGDNAYISVFREKREWYWCLWGVENDLLWETDDYGPFPTLRMATEDAIYSYEDFLD